MAEVNRELLAELYATGTGFELIKGQIYFHSLEDYKNAKKVLKRLGLDKKKNSRAWFDNKKVRMLLFLEDDSHSLVHMKTVPTVFDSEDEADMYFYLRDEQEAGIIERIEIHPRLELFGKCTSLDSRKIPPLIYTPDFFVVYTQAGIKKHGTFAEYIEFKSNMATEGALLRRRLYDFLAAKATNRPYSGVPLRWIGRNFKHSTHPDGWLNWDELQRILAANRKAKKGAA